VAMSGRSLSPISGTSMSGINQITLTSIIPSMTIYSLMTSTSRNTSEHYEHIRSLHLHLPCNRSGPFFIQPIQITIHQMKITQIHQEYSIKEGTKTVYELRKETTLEITYQRYQNITDPDWAKYNRSLGGTETINRGYTKRGYLVTEIVSKSPKNIQGVRTTKSVRKFKFN